MTTGRINQVCQMLLLTVLFHESMDQQSQTAAKAQSCSQLKEQHLNTHSKHCSVRGTHYLTPDAKAPAPTDRRRRHQPPARAWKPMLRQESLYPESRNDHKEPFGRLRNGTATVPQDQTPTRGSELPSLNGFHGPKRVRKGSLHRAAPQTPLYI